MIDDGELSGGRNFDVYRAGMDASVAVKLRDIVPLVVPGVIADKGCGTGLLLVHLSGRFPGSRLVGMDLSEKLLQTARSKPYPGGNVEILWANIIHQHFPAGSLSTVIFSSVMHEIYSYNGYDREQVRVALRNARTELRAGGRVIIRDGVRPEDRSVWMTCDAETEARFRRFAHDFKGQSSNPGVAFTEQLLNGRMWFRLSLSDANEYLSKKDYLENWPIEVNEEFGVFSLDQWQRELEALRYRILEARSYVNPWILDHRYRGRVWLHADDGGQPGEALPFPDTTAVIAGEAV